MREKIDLFLKEWGRMILLTVVQIWILIPLGLTWMIGQDTGNWGPSNWAIANFLVVFYGSAVLFGIFSKEDKLKNAIKFLFANLLNFLFVFFIVAWYLYLSRGITPW